MNTTSFGGESVKTVYRFTTVKWLLDSIVNNRNTLVSPRKWNDPFENALAEQVRFHQPGDSTSPYALRNRAYGQCWTLDPETDAFWRMYCPHGDGVRLRSTTRELINTLRMSIRSYRNTSCFIEAVQYESEETITTKFKDKLWVEYNLLKLGTRGHVNTLLLKRMEFKTESEIRLLYLDPYNKDHGDLFSYKIDPSVTPISMD